jgi:lipopolysaccharide transport system ATP-binding protein
VAIIEVNHVTKEFRLGQLRSLKQTVLDLLSRLRGHRIAERTPFKALDDVSFGVEQGEVLGIIGQNGAGKSTLLKILAGISAPTRGSISVQGRVAPLIEVGAGLVADLTGRENIFLNASILGMKRVEIAKKFDEIVAFAELDEFIDTPIKRYSSGMQVRLGFSIATSVDAEILIVDEVLAVGDLAFQRKCFDRMEEMIKRQGRTVLIVSHNIRQVERMCTRVILLEHGRVAFDGAPQPACNLFYEKNDQKIKNQIVRAHAGPKRSFVRSRDLLLTDITMLNEAGEQIERVKFGSTVLIRLLFHTKIPLHDPTFGIGAHTPDLLYVANDDSILTETEQRIIPPGSFQVEYKIRDFPLLPSVYALRVGVALKNSDLALYYGENLFHFQVYDDKTSRSRTVNQGFISFGGTWSFEVPAG